jgi:hypothetical protein
MTETSNIIPPQPRRRIVKRQVKARRFAQATSISSVGLAASVLFGYDALLSRHSGLVLWLALVLVGVMLACALVAGFFFLTEQPKQVEVIEDPFSGTHVIHLTPKQ